MNFFYIEFTERGPGLIHKQYTTQYIIFNVKQKDL